MTTASPERVAAAFSAPLRFRTVATTPEALVALCIGLAADIGFLALGVVPTAVAVALTVAGWSAAIWGGSNGMALASVTATLVLGGIGLTPLEPGLGVWTLLGVAAVAQLDAYRLVFFRRRRAELRPEAIALVAVGTIRVAAVSIVFATAVALVESSSRTTNWLLVPVLVAVLTLGALVTLVVVMRGRDERDRARWTPGLRLPSQGIGLTRSPDQPPPPRAPHR